jgi:hypothetical protein
MLHEPATLAVEVFGRNDKSTVAYQTFLSKADCIVDRCDELVEY